MPCTHKYQSIIIKASDITTEMDIWEAVLNPNTVKFFQLFDKAKKRERERFDRGIYGRGKIWSTSERHVDA